MDDLWASQREQRRRAVEPLAVRMRPRTLAEFVGQEHVLGRDTLLRRMLAADRLTSIVFHGPPGTGKTAVAEVIARETGRHFEGTNATLVGVKEIRRILDEATRRLEDRSVRTILFLDEIHRFARNQQDVLLNDVERGVVTLIGATTENPLFSVNSALVSRSTLFRFEPLSEDDVATLVRRAAIDERGFAHLALDLHDDAVAHWARMSDGDARRALNALEVAVLSRLDERATAGDTDADAGPIVIDRRCAEESIQAKAIVHDATGDEHYDVISALIKSMRGGDTDGALYWLARMLEAGEDPRYIARRVAILASEDVGNADPNAMVVASSAWAITERVGMPECRYALAQAVIYMSRAPKSRATADAIARATEDVREGRTVPVPEHLLNRQRPGVKADSARRGPDRVYYRPAPGGFEDQMSPAREQLSGNEERESGGDVSDE
jgi:putative ATPase